MDKIFTGSSKKKQTVLILIMVVMFGSTFFLVYKNFISPTPEIARPAATDEPSTSRPLQVDNFASVQNNASIVEILAGLVKFGDWPVTLSALGRSSPFLPP